MERGSKSFIICSHAMTQSLPSITVFTKLKLGKIEFLKLIINDALAIDKDNYNMSSCRVLDISVKKTIKRYHCENKKHA